MPAFAVAEDHVTAADVQQHRRADLAGEGAFLFGIEILPAQPIELPASDLGRQRRDKETADRPRAGPIFLPRPLSTAVANCAAVALW